MAGLKALALWVPQERRALANGSFIMFGGLGAMTSTVPVNLLLPMVGWRGVFLLLAALTLASALLVLAVVPEKRTAAPAEDWCRSLHGLLAVYRDPVFWRLAPLSACVVGAAFAMHGLWAARWLAEVDRFTPDHIASVVLMMGAGLTLGAAVIGLVTDRLRRHGVPSTTTFGLASALFIALQATVLGRLPLPAWLQWSTIASFGSMTVLSYSIMGELFPLEQIGRANGALNVLHLSMAFVLQYGMGLIASLWHPNASGRLPVIAYRAAFALPLLLELIALGWFVASLLASVGAAGATCAQSQRKPDEQYHPALRVPDVRDGHRLVEAIPARSPLPQRLCHAPLAAGFDPAPDPRTSICDRMCSIPSPCRGCCSRSGVASSGRWDARCAFRPPPPVS